MRNPQSSREGYLFVDHRASPGLPADFARRMGYDPADVAEGKLLEAATLGCAHCQAVVIKNPERQRKRESCMKCGGSYICDYCYAQMQHPDYIHTPFEKIVDVVLGGKTPELPISPLLMRLRNG